MGSWVAELTMLMGSSPLLKKVALQERKGDHLSLPRPKGFNVSLKTTTTIVGNPPEGLHTLEFLQIWWGEACNVTSACNLFCANGNGMKLTGQSFQDLLMAL